MDQDHLGGVYSDAEHHEVTCATIGKIHVYIQVSPNSVIIAQFSFHLWVFLLQRMLYSLWLVELSGFTKDSTLVGKWNLGLTPKKSNWNIPTGDTHRYFSFLWAPSSYSRHISKTESHWIEIWRCIFCYFSFCIPYTDLLCRENTVFRLKILNMKIINAVSHHAVISTYPIRSTPR